MLKRDPKTDAIPKLTRRAVSYSPKYNLLYITNQKAGSSMLKNWLMRVETGDHTFDEENIHENTALPSPRELGRERIRELLLGQGRCFTFVRNPARRAASVYFARVKRPFMKSRYPILDALDRPHGDDRISFDDFLTALERMDPATMDPHWRPQYINIMHGTVDYHMIGRLETVDSDLDRLCDELSIPRMPSEQKNAKTPSGLYDKLIGARRGRKARLARIYARDFELFGYDL